MSEVELHHHLYSSLRGYRTLYSSGMSPRDVKTLERVASEVAKMVSGESLKEVFHLASGLSCQTRAFLCGSDHVGRTRVCVHTVAVARTAAESIPFFTPFLFPDEVFVPADYDFAEPAEFLCPSFSYTQGDDVVPEITWGKKRLARRLKDEPRRPGDSWRERLGQAFDRSLLDPERASCLIRCLLESPQRRIYVFGGPDTFEVLKGISPILPLPVRSGLSISSIPKIESLGEILPAVVVAPASVIDVSSLSSGAQDRDGFIAVDFNTPAFTELLERNDYANFVVHSRSDLESLLGLVGFIDARESEAPITRSGYSDVVYAYRLLRASIDAEGDFRQGSALLEDDPLMALQYAISVLRAGVPALSAALVEKVWEACRRKFPSLADHTGTVRSVAGVLRSVLIPIHAKEDALDLFATNLGADVHEHVSAHSTSDLLARLVKREDYETLEGLVDYDT